MEQVYKKASKPSDLLWHSEEPSKLVEAIQGKMLGLKLRVPDTSDSEGR